MRDLLSEFTHCIFVKSANRGGCGSFSRAARVLMILLGLNLTMVQLPAAHAKSSVFSPYRSYVKYRVQPCDNIANIVIRLHPEMKQGQLKMISGILQINKLSKLHELVVGNTLKIPEKYVSDEMLASNVHDGFLNLNAHRFQTHSALIEKQCLAVSEAAQTTLATQETSSETAALPTSDQSAAQLAEAKSASVDSSVFAGAVSLGSTLLPIESLAEDALSVAPPTSKRPDPIMSEVTREPATDSAIVSGAVSPSPSLALAQAPPAATVSTAPAPTVPSTAVAPVVAVSPVPVAPVAPTVLPATPSVVPSVAPAMVVSGDLSTGLEFFVAVGGLYYNQEESISSYDVHYNAADTQSVHVGSSMTLTDQTSVGIEYLRGSMHYNNEAYSLADQSGTLSRIVAESSTSIGRLFGHDLRFDLGLQYVDTTLAFFADSDNSPLLTQAHILSASVGVEGHKKFGERSRASYKFHYLLPVKTSLGDYGSTSSISNVMMFDGSVGFERLLMPHGWIGFFWHGLYYSYNLKYSDPRALYLSGSYNLLLSSPELRFTVDY